MQWGYSVANSPVFILHERTRKNICYTNDQVPLGEYPGTIHRQTDFGAQTGFPCFSRAKHVVNFAISTPCRGNTGIRYCLYRPFFHTKFAGFNSRAVVCEIFD